MIKSRTNKKHRILTIPLVNTFMEIFRTSESFMAIVGLALSTGMLEHCVGPIIGLVTRRLM